MELSKEKIREYMARLLSARLRVLCNHGFFGLLLMHMVYAIDESADTAWTDGERIAFGPRFLDSLSDSEIEFVLMHEVLHVVLNHCSRSEDLDHDRYNIAADIVINSIILQENGGRVSSITLSKYGESMHVAPNGKEGHLYTAEEIYDMLPAKANKGKCSSGDGFAKGRAKKDQAAPQNTINPKIWDDHGQWGKFEDDEIFRDVWVKNFEDACSAVTVLGDGNGRGKLPMFAKRILDKLVNPQLDWRILLNEFIQEDVNDYSFSPPDRRYEGDFFLPDFNEKTRADGEADDILFMIDTSASISDKMMSVAYSEVLGAINQFNGKLKGWLGFFDAAIIKPKPFCTAEEFKKIKPAGGGGTDFRIIFEYVHTHMAEKPPACIIILTDGYAPFPSEKLAKNVPVLWLINNDDVSPPWGKVARIKIK